MTLVWWLPLLTSLYVNFYLNAYRFCIVLALGYLQVSKCAQDTVLFCSVYNIVITIIFFLHCFYLDC